MKKLFETIKNNPLFSGIAFSDFAKLFSCLSAKRVCYQCGDTILLSGDAINFVGLVVSGGVQIVKEDRNGNPTILTELTSSELFGEVFACAEIDHSPVTVETTEESEIVLIDYRKMITSCPSACPFHGKLIENMLRLIANKNLVLNQKIEIISKRTTREKLLCFFDFQRGGRSKFAVPFNRERMAQYLCVDRSAMSNELCKMRDEGLIRFQKNHFEIL